MNVSHIVQLLKYPHSKNQAETMTRTIASSLMATLIAFLCLVGQALSAATLLPNGEQCFQATSPTSGGLSGPLATLGTISAGAAYVNGTYTNVPLTGGSGFGATATITVTGNIVVNASLTNLGTHYAAGDVLSASNANLGGAGSGFSVPILTVSTTGTGMLGLMGPIIGGTGGVTGTYGGVALTGGSGSGATANITVTGGAVTAVTILNPGLQFVVADVLSAAPGTIGGTTGFSISVSSVTINQSLAGGSVAMFIPNTNTFKQTWQNATQTILNANPVTLDQNGCATIYGTGSYRQVLQDALGDVVWDKITTDTSAQQNTFWAGIAGGTPNAITLVDPGFNATDGSVINFTALFTNTGATTINPSGFGAITVEKDTTGGPQGLGGGEIVAGNPISVIYRSTDNAFHILNPVIVNNTNQCLNITAFGGAGNNITDNTTPLVNAFNAMTGSGGCIYFQPGKYKFNSQPTINLPSGIFSFTLRGSGQDNTVLTWPNASGGMIVNYAGIGASVHVSDISFTTSVAGGGDGIKLNQSSAVTNPANTAVSDLTRVTFRGDDGYAIADYWSNGVNVANVSNVNFDTVSVTGPSGVSGNGINLLGLPGSSTYAVQFNIAKSTFNNLQAGIVYGSFVQGVTVSQSNFVADANGIISPAAQTGSLAQLAVNNSQFGILASQSGIATVTAIAETQISNSLFIVQGANATGINLAANAHFTITGNEITSNNLTNTNGILVSNTAGGAKGIITGNDFFGYATGVALTASAARVAVVSNTLTGNTADFSNACGASCTITPNY
jgi:hypothetical protein